MTYTNQNIITTIRENKDSETTLFRKHIGKTTYLVGGHFGETSRESLEDKFRRLIREEAKNL